MVYGQSFMVDLVILSHHHTDHTHGLKPYLETMELLGRTKPLRIYTPDPKALGSQVKTSGWSYPITVIPITTGVSYLEPPMVIRFFKAHHGRIAAVGVLIQSLQRQRYDRARLLRDLPPDARKQLFMVGQCLYQGRTYHKTQYRLKDTPWYSVYYSGDTTWDPHVLDNLHPRGLMIHQCTYVRGQDRTEARRRHHTHYGQLIAHMKSQPQRFILTHISDRVTPQVLNTYRLPPNGSWAYDGLEFTNNIEPQAVDP